MSVETCRLARRVVAEEDADRRREERWASGPSEGWLARIATTTCLNLLCSASRRPEAAVADLTEEEAEWLANNPADESAPTVERSLIAADLADKVLETLPPDDRMVLMLADGEGASTKEVAEATGWSESKVEVQAFRARWRMREALEKLLAGPRRSSS